MPLESGTVVADLVITNPTASDGKNLGDDHLRLLKTVLRNSFAGFAGNILVSGTDGGAADAYTLTPTTTLTAYSTKMLVEFTPNATNTGAATLNISGLGAKNIYSVAGAALSAGELVSGRYYLAAYDGTQFRLISVTKAYVDSLVSALPPGTLPSVTGKDTTWYLSPDATGTTIQWTQLSIPTAGLKLLATLTPTAAANVDFLTTFTSTYDNYLIVGQGIKPATTQRLVMRFANSGSVDSGSNYVNVTINVTGSILTATQYVSFYDTLSTGKGVNFCANVLNVNSASGHKTTSIVSLTHESGANSYGESENRNAYIGGAVSGVRLYWESGSNFAAQGTIYVYGYSKT